MLRGLLKREMLDALRLPLPSLRRRCLPSFSLPAIPVIRPGSQLVIGSRNQVLEAGSERGGLNRSDEDDKVEGVYLVVEV